MLEQLRKARDFDPGAHLPLYWGERRVGWVQPGFLNALHAYPRAFSCGAEAVRMLGPGELDAAIRNLAAEGWISGWRNERYEVCSGGEALFTLERAAFRRFGLRARAVHLNGWVRDGDGCRLWVARRSVTKPIDPGMLDNLVGGGIASGLTAAETLAKECVEEAGIPPALSRHACAAGSLRVTRTVDVGVHDELVHVYDLELPPGFEPVNQDGEVAGFMLLDTAAAAKRLQADEFTVDAGTVLIDFLWRRGALVDPAIGDMLATLRQAPD